MSSSTTGTIIFPGYVSWCPFGSWVFEKDTEVALTNGHWIPNSSSAQSISDPVSQLIMQSNGELKCPADATYLLQISWDLSDFCNIDSASDIEINIQCMYRPRNDKSESPDYKLIEFTSTINNPVILSSQRCIMNKDDVISVKIKCNKDMVVDVNHKSCLKYANVSQDTVPQIFVGSTDAPPQFQPGNNTSRHQKTQVIDGKAILVLTQDATLTGQSLFQNEITSVNVEILSLKPVDTDITPIRCIAYSTYLNPNLKYAEVVVAYASSGMLVENDSYVVFSRMEGN